MACRKNEPSPPSRAPVRARELDVPLSYLADQLPSKRAYAAQFRRWNLPSKHQPAFKDAALVARVRVLWERNLSQSEMLRVLTEEDGFHINSRELSRVRSKNRWLLRAPADDATRLRSASASASASQTLAADGVPRDDGGRDDANDDFMACEEEGAGGALQAITDRRLKMEAESAERWAAKKRRRRTRQYAGLPADPPGPPRFPSETTLAESQVILGLDKVTYAAVRDRFQEICQSAGITKKTLAGPEAWERAKNTLVQMFPALEEVGPWLDGGDKAALDARRVALDVICCDVTKRMRASAVGVEKGMPLAEAKNVLGLNPTESQEVRATFYEILKRGKFTSKVALGRDGWKDLKQRWVDESDMLRKVLSRLDDDARSREMKTKAVEAIATDVLKRVRADQNKRKGDKQDGTSAAEAAAMGSAEFDGGHAGMGEIGDDASGFATAMLVPEQQPHAHNNPPRLMPVPNHLVDPQMSMQMPMDSPMGSSLLLDPNAQSGFMGTHQQFIPTPAPLTAASSPFETTQAAGYPLSATGTSLIPFYLREIGPGDTLGDVWIAVLTSSTPSLAELRHVAAQKIPGSTCVEVIGMVRMPNGMGGQQMFPLPILNDGQLGAHLAQEGPPMFHVRLSF